MIEILGACQWLAKNAGPFSNQLYVAETSLWISWRPRPLRSEGKTNTSLQIGRQVAYHKSPSRSPCPNPPTVSERPEFYNQSSLISHSIVPCMLSDLSAHLLQRCNFAETPSHLHGLWQSMNIAGGCGVTQSGQWRLPMCNRAVCDG